MTTIYLFRHGQYESPDKIVPYRLPGFHLSNRGIAEVAEVAEKLANFPISAVYTSPLERTFETAIILAKSFGLTPIIDERLLEVRSPSQGEKEGFVEEKGGWGIYETEWYKDQGGESLDEIVSRMKEAIEEIRIRHEGKEIIVVSHGDSIMLLKAVYKSISLTPEALSKQQYISMASGYKINFNNLKISIQPL